MSNAIRCAGMVRDAADSLWSSARIHLGGGWDGLVDLAPWSERWTLDEWREFLSATEFERESEAIRRSTHSGRPLGSPQFVERLEGELARPLQARHGGRPKKKSASRETGQRLLAAM
jgi:putative transposase